MRNQRLRRAIEFNALAHALYRFIPADRPKTVVIEMDADGITDMSVTYPVPAKESHA